MADTSPEAPMRPQDTVIFLLGEINGKVGALQLSVESSNAAQSAVNAANDKEHSEFRTELAKFALEIAVIKERQPTKTPWYSVVAGVVGIVTGIGATIGLIVVLTQFANLSTLN